MEKVYIIGASGFGREVAWLIEENNDYKIEGFIDDDLTIQQTLVNGYKVIGTVHSLLEVEEDINVVIAIGKSHIRSKIIEKLMSHKNIHYPNIISKDVKQSKYIEYGEGNIICAGNILTTNIKIGNFNHINLNCTIGHDVVIRDYITVYPSVNISGNVEIDDYCELGTGSKIIQCKKICKDIILGAGGVVTKDIEESGTYVGSPTRKVK